MNICFLFFPLSTCVRGARNDYRHLSFLSSIKTLKSWSTCQSVFIKGYLSTICRLLSQSPVVFSYRPTYWSLYGLLLPSDTLYSLNVIVLHVSSLCGFLLLSNTLNNLCSAPASLTQFPMDNLWYLGMSLLCNCASWGNWGVIISFPQNWLCLAIFSI